MHTHIEKFLGFIFGCVVVYFGGMFVGRFVIPSAEAGVTYARLQGVWHVDGKYEDWRINSDGTIYDEAPLMTSKWKYELLSGDRLRITGPVGYAQLYKVRFEG